MRARSGNKSEVYATTMSSRGQVVLPARLRRKLGLRKGARLSISVGEKGDNTLVLRRMEADPVRELRGILKGASEALDFLQEERRRDRERGR